MVRKKRKAVVNSDMCVACGACMKECPLNAITIEKGIFANVDFNRCVGCGKCVRICPASVIKINEFEVVINEK